MARNKEKRFCTALDEISAILYRFLLFLCNFFVKMQFFFLRNGNGYSILKKRFL